MSLLQPYCLDANVLIQAWQGYYAPHICPSYWDRLNDLGQQGRIFIPRMVFTEIERGEGALFDWVRQCRIPVREMTEPVTRCLSQMFAADDNHKRLVDNATGRSAADPWVIAHAMEAGAHVVTREHFVTDPRSRRPKIPNVCQTMGIRWMNDYQFVSEIGLQFTCSLPAPAPPAAPASPAS